MSYVGLHYLVALPSIPSPPPTIIVRQEGGEPSWVWPLLSAVIGAVAAIVGGIVASWITRGTSREERVWPTQLDAYYGVMTWWIMQEREIEKRLALLERETYEPPAVFNKFSALSPEVEAKFRYFIDSSSEKDFANLRKAVSKLEERGDDAESRKYYLSEYKKLLIAGQDFTDTMRAVSSRKRTLKRGRIISS